MEQVEKKKKFLVKDLSARWKLCNQPNLLHFLVLYIV